MNDYHLFTLVHSKSYLTNKIDIEDQKITSGLDGRDWVGHGFIAQNPITGVMVLVHRISTFHPGQDDNSSDIAIIKSQDNGKTWINLSGIKVDDENNYEPSIILDGGTDWDYNNFNGGYTPTGRLIIMGRRMIYPFDAANKVFNFIIYSDDDGILWTPEIELEISGLDLHTWAVNSPLIVLDNGEIAIAGAGAKYTTFVSVYTFKTLIIKSDDNGVTWTGKIIHSRESSENSWKATEPSICDLGSGYILCLARDEGPDRSNSYRQFISKDYGVNWDELGITSFVSVIETKIKRPAIIYPAVINGIKLVACYYGYWSDQKVKVIYGLARELIDDEDAWNVDTIIDLFTGQNEKVGYQTAVHELDGAEAIIAVTDDQGGESEIKLIHLKKEALGSIIDEILG